MGGESVIVVASILNAVLFLFWHFRAGFDENDRLRFGAAARFGFFSWRPDLVLSSPGFKLEMSSKIDFCLFLVGFFRGETNGFRAF